MRLARPAFALCLLVAAPAALAAADWMLVTSDRVRRVELDRSSVMTSEGGTKVAWGRIVLSDAQAKEAGYKTVRALNRYDCRTRSFVIIKRVYLADDERTVRDEKVGADNAIAIRPGTVDEKFFNEVCKPAGVAELREVARRASEQAEAARAELPVAKPRHADIRLAKEEAPAAAAVPPAATGTKPIPSATPAVPPPVAPPVPAARALESPAPGLQPVPLVPSRAPAPRPVVRPAPVKQAVPAGAAVADKPDAHDVHHWSYEGPGGPENWGRLSPGFSLCGKGTRQSPIDIRDGIRVDQEPIAFSYQPSFVRVIDNGHTIQVNYGSGSTLSVMGRNYELVQFHFHRPSEERVDGRAFDMVAHLVHKDAEGRLAVLAVLLERGKENAFIQSVWNNLPLEKNIEFSSRSALDMNDLLPTRRDYYAYMGSLTTPPCTEGVLWLVLKQPVQLSAEQIGVFSRFYSNNARPVQATAGRIIKESR